jgi:hypothetical protein
VAELLGILAALGAIMAASVVTTVLVVRTLYRRVRRSRAVDRAILHTRAGLSRGPQRKVLELRLQLKDTLDSGQAAVDIAGRSTWPRGELPQLFRRIKNEGVALDTQLRLMESETESGVLTEQLPVARERVEQVSGLVRRVRSAVASGLAGPTDAALAELRADVDREVAALRAGLQELHALYERDGLVDRSR